MRENFTKTGSKGADDRIYLEGDWYSFGISSNVILGKGVYIDTSFGFSQFYASQPEALVIDEGSGCYDRSTLIVEEDAEIKVGKYCILNGTTLICRKSITIGDHCMMAWGSVLTDSWLDVSLSTEQRRSMLLDTAASTERRFPFFGEAKPIVLEDNCWVGFGAVIMPGVRLGKGCVVGCKSVIDFDVPAYAVVAGAPPKIIKYLNPDDTEEEKQKAFLQYVRR